MSEPILPYWFKQRQAKLEPAGDQLYKVTAPNAPEVFVGVRPGANGCWTAYLKTAADAADTLAADTDFPGPQAAWEAAFELYRRHIIY